MCLLFVLLAMQEPVDLEARLKTHVELLASDALEGRGTGEPGGEAAAAYIESRLRGWGFSVQSHWFEVPAASRPGATRLVRAGIAPVDAALEPEALPAVFSGDGSAQGVTAASGSTDLDGRIVVIRGGNPHQDDRAMVLDAVRAGACGAVIVEEGEGPLVFKDRPTAPVPVPVVRTRSVIGIGDSWSITTRVERDRVRVRNLLGVVSGRRDDGSVVLGAHYDHLGRGRAGSSLAPDRSGEVHNGADDNASGTAAVLEAARLLAAGPRPERPVIVAFFAAEERGLLGSAALLEDRVLDPSSVVAMVNLDMVGRSHMGSLQVGGAGTATALEQVLVQANGAEGTGLDLSVSRGGAGVGGSDHMSFAAKRIPNLFFFTGLHAEYHRPEDDTDLVNFADLGRITRLAVATARGLGVVLADGLAWIEPPPPKNPRTTSFRVRLGTIPDYSDHPEGMRITGVTKGSPAAEAGLEAGDVLTGMGDVAIESVYDLTYALSVFAPGESTEVRYLRAGVAGSAIVTFAAD